MNDFKIKKEKRASLSSVYAEIFLKCVWPFYNIAK